MRVLEFACRAPATCIHVLWCSAQRARVSVSNVHALQLMRARLGNLEGCFVEKRVAATRTVPESTVMTLSF